MEILNLIGQLLCSLPQNITPTVALEDICRVVCELLRKHLPGVYDHLWVFCEILPLNWCPATYPFPGFVLNLGVCTKAHVDANDNKICVIIPFRPHKGGELVLYKAGLVLDLKEGDILIFPSAAKWPEKIYAFGRNLTGDLGDSLPMQNVT
jgi:hypothetical protein